MISIIKAMSITQMRNLKIFITPRSPLLLTFSPFSCASFPSSHPHCHGLRSDSHHLLPELLYWPLHCSPTFSSLPITSFFVHSQNGP